MDGTTPNFLRRLLAVLRQAAAPAPIWHLDERQRWEIFRDVLLGHASIRGGQRPRDFPLDRDAREMLSLATELHAMPISSQPAGSFLDRKLPKRPIRFGPWLVGFVVSITAETEIAPWPVSAVKQEGNPWRQCIQFCIAMMGSNGQMDSHRSSIDNPAFAHRILASLGLNQQAVTKPNHELGGGDWGKVVRRLASQAAVMALVVDYGPEVLAPVQPPLNEENRPIPRDLVDALNTRKVGLLQIKTEHVQAYIDRAVKQYLRRGASAWCAQMLASVRDYCVENRLGIPIVDADAVCILVTPPKVAASTVRDRLEKWLEAMWSQENEPGALKTYPRLAPRLLALPKGYDPRACLPSFKFISRRHTTLLDLCQPEARLDSATLEARRHEWADNGDLCLLEPPAQGTAQGAQPCPRVRGDVVVTDQVPPWHDFHGHPEPQGWLSWVWSLAGSTAKQLSLNGICDLLGDLSMPAYVHHGDLLASLKMQDKSLVILKLDGDGVGEHLATKPFIRKPAVGLAIAHDLNLRLEAGCKAVYQAMLTTPGMNRGVPFALSVDYLGGDDLQVTLPGPFATPFLKAFAEGDGFGITYSWAGLRQPHMPTREERTELSEFAHSLIGPLLNLVKAVRKRDEKQADEARTTLAKTARPDYQLIQDKNVVIDPPSLAGCWAELQRV